MSEIKSLTSLRGIASLYVVILHYFNIHKDYPDGLPFYKRFIYTFIQYGYFTVDLFFILSAFVMCLAYKKYFQTKVEYTDYKFYMLKRFARLYPLYIVFCFVYFFLFDKDTFSLLSNITLLQIPLAKNFYLIDVFWSLSAEWVLYLIFPILFFYFNKIKNIYLNLCILLLSITGLYCLKFLPQYAIDNFKLVNFGIPYSNNIPFGFSAILRCFCGYIIGISLFQLLYEEHSTWLKKFLHPIFVVPICCILFIQHMHYFVIPLFVLLIASCYINNSEYKIFNSGIIYKLGLWSYSIYVCHRAVMYIVDNNLNISPTLQNILAIVITILLSSLTYNLIEKFFNQKINQLICRK